METEQENTRQEKLRKMREVARKMALAVEFLARNQLLDEGVFPPTYNFGGYRFMLQNGRFMSLGMSI